MRLEGRGYFGVILDIWWVHVWWNLNFFCWKCLVTYIIFDNQINNELHDLLIRWNFIITFFFWLNGMLIWDRNSVPEAFTWLDGLLFCGVFGRAYGMKFFSSDSYQIWWKVNFLWWTMCTWFITSNGIYDLKLYDLTPNGIYDLK